MVDPFTARKRAKIFSKRNFAAEIGRLQKLNQLNAVKIVGKIPEVLALIERNQRHTPREKAFLKAKYLSDRAAILTDTRIDAEIKAEAKEKGIAEFEALPIQKKKEIWDKNYESAIEWLLSRPKFAADPAIKEQLRFLRDFFRLPKKIYEEREKHWRIVKKVGEASIKGNKNPNEGLAKQIDRLLSRVRPGQHLTTKAMDICIAVSIYADIMERRGENWPDAYMNGMKAVYQKIKDNEPLLDAIAAI